MKDGVNLKGLLPGGASTDFLTEQHLDTPMDFDSISKAGSRLGTGGLIVLGDKHCPVAMVLNLLRFFCTRVLRLVYSLSRWYAVVGRNFNAY